MPKIDEVHWLDLIVPKDHPKTERLVAEGHSQPGRI